MVIILLMNLNSKVKIEHDISINKANEMEKSYGMMLKCSSLY
jgi:hypothetical protein